MGAYELLESLLEQLAAGLPPGGVPGGLRAEQGSRRVGEAHRGRAGGKGALCAGGWSGKLELTVFLPRGTGPGEAEPLLAAVEAAARELAPGFRGMERGKAQQDKPTGLLAIPCAVEFAGLDGGGGEVTLGGKTYPIAGWSIAVSTEGRELVSIGESQAFALEDRRTRYTVELEGLDTQGLERLARFTAKLGESPETYVGCRWKSLSAKPGGVRLLPAAGGDSITRTGGMDMDGREQAQELSRELERDSRRYPAGF